MLLVVLEVKNIPADVGDEKSHGEAMGTGWWLKERQRSLE